LEVFLELYEAIVATLETIKANADRSWNADSTKKAVSHYHAIANFDFVVTLTVCQAVLAFTKGLTVKMQGISSGILGVFSDTKDVVKTLSSVRQKVEENQSGFKKHAKLPRSRTSQCKNQEPVRYNATLQTTHGRRQLWEKPYDSLG